MSTPVSNQLTNVNKDSNTNEKYPSPIQNTNQSLNKITGKRKYNTEERSDDKSNENTSAVLFVPRKKETPLSCTECEYNKCDKTCLTYHLWCALRSGSSSVLSSIVQPHSVFSEENYDSHIKEELLDEPQFEVEETFENTYNSQQVYRITLTSVGLISCPHCDVKMYIEFYQNIIKHIVSHGAYKYETDYKCSECGYVTLNEKEFTNHAPELHYYKFHYKCTICNFKCDLLSQMITHLNKYPKHKLESLYICTYCKMELRQRHRSIFIKHLANHTKIKCSECPPKKSKKLWFEHFKKVHANHENDPKTLENPSSSRRSSRPPAYLHDYE